ILAADLSGVDGAKVQIVPRPRLVGSAVRDLGETAEVRTDSSGKEGAALIKRKIVVGLGIVGRRLVHRAPRVHVVGDGHGRDGDALLQPKRVAAELELAAERSELRPEAT